MAIRRWNDDSRDDDHTAPTTADMSAAFAAALSGEGGASLGGQMATGVGCPHDDCLDPGVPGEPEPL